MSTAALRKGWCPTLLSPMESGDGWLARVKPSAAKFDTNQARVIADAARHYRAACPSRVNDRSQRLVVDKDHVGLIDDDGRLPKLYAAKQRRFAYLDTEEAARHKERDDAKERGLARIGLG